MEIRDFQPQDRQAYLDMAVDFYSGNASLFDVDMKKFEDTFDIGVKGSELMRGLIITEGEQYIGYALLAFYWSCEAGGFVVQAEELYFTPETRGKGCGHRFFEWLFAAYPQARWFRLEVCPKNPQAKKLYSKLGFQDLDYAQMVLDRYGSTLPMGEGAKPPLHSPLYGRSAPNPG